MSKLIPVVAEVRNICSETVHFQDKEIMGVVGIISFTPEKYRELENTYSLVTNGFDKSNFVIAVTAGFIEQNGETKCIAEVGLISNQNMAELCGTDLDKAKQLSVTDIKAVRQSVVTVVLDKSDTLKLREEFDKEMKNYSTLSVNDVLKNIAKKEKSNAQVERD